MLFKNIVFGNEDKLNHENNSRYIENKLIYNDEMIKFDDIDLGLSTKLQYGNTKG